MTISSVADAIPGLAGRYANYLLHGNSVYLRISPEYFIKDGRRRARIWRELLEEGYVVRDKCAADRGSSEGFVTAKAFESYPEGQPFVLADLFKYDLHNHREGRRVYVGWDSLSLMQKVRVVKALRKDPSAYRLAYVSDQYGSNVTVKWFALGGGNEAAKALGERAYGTIVITDASVEAKYREGAIAHAHGECLGDGLNWFLHRQGVLHPEDKVPVQDKTPLFGYHASLSRDPAKWQADLSSVIQRTQAEIAGARVRLDLLLKLEAAVHAAGGHEAFRAAYEAAVSEHVSGLTIPPANPDS